MFLLRAFMLTASILKRVGESENLSLKSSQDIPIMR